MTQIRRRNNGVFPQVDLEEMLLASSRASESAAVQAEVILWGPIFQSLDSNPALARARVTNLLAFLESIQE